MALKLALDSIKFDRGTKTAIVRAEDVAGRLVVTVLITRRFFEISWGMLHFSEEAVRRRIAGHAAELTTHANQAHATGNRRVVLDNLSELSRNSVPEPVLS